MLRGTWISLFAATLFLTSAAVDSKAQARFKVETTSSLAWWQMDPHFGYLWATTCPQDTTWQAGAIHSTGYRYTVKKDPVKGRPLDEKATIQSHIPVYDRRVASPGCTPAVSGEISAMDTTTWRGVRGLISIHAPALVTGLNFRDDFARKRVMQSDEYPEIRFLIDSLTSVKKVGDTLDATAVGTFEFHGTKTPWGIPIRAWRESLGLRVTGHFAFPAKELVTTYGVPLIPLGMGVGAGMWKWFHLGIDAVMTEEGRSRGASR